ncbi:MAG TPA: hypothetical protein VFK02_03045 [Kofleriaceae bacterium]|nr:hypothetical protein [Kofleriaceae bacterium]
MNRPALAPSSPTHLNALDAGLCLLGAEILRRYHLPCPSDAEILSCSAYGPPHPDNVESESQHLRERITAYLIDGMVLAGQHRRPSARRR